MYISMVEKIDMVNIYRALVGIEMGKRGGVVQTVSENYATKLTGCYQSWISGENLRQSMGNDAFYRARRVLLAGLGVDISKPSNVIAMPIRFRTFELRELEPPRWYRGVDQAVTE
ncbi:MAG: hypothetical protein HQL75_05920 [Magnetococcales bacterium]|nr:hypothetical protein [Magnetococcales bacterium]